jgi:hypothetical protein
MGLAFPVAMDEIDSWQKDSLVMPRMDYRYRHEPSSYGWRSGQASMRVMGSPDRDPSMRLHQAQWRGGLKATQRGGA